MISPSLTIAFLVLISMMHLQNAYEAPPPRNLYHEHHHHHKETQYNESNRSHHPKQLDVAYCPLTNDVVSVKTSMIDQGCSFIHSFEFILTHSFIDVDIHIHSLTILSFIHNFYSFGYILSRSHSNSFQFERGTYL